MQTTEQIEALEISEYERERGKPMPNLSHSAIELRLGAVLLNQARNRYIVGSELTLEFADGLSLTPDLVVLHLREISWGLEPSRCREVPLMVVEIDSPTQGYLEVMRKRDLYFSQGVESVWVVDPSIQAIAIYRPGVERPQIIQQGEAKDPATGLTVRLEEIFS